MTSGLRNLHLDAIEVDALGRNPLEQLEIVVPEPTKLLVIPEKVLRGWRHNNSNHANNGISKSAHSAGPNPLYRVILHMRDPAAKHALSRHLGSSPIFGAPSAAS
jgi:hypothetical protein